MVLDFKNRFGLLKLALLTDVMPVRDIRGTNIDNIHKFPIDQAEQVALITDNRGIQISTVKADGQWLFYIVVHDSPSTGAVARVETIAYTGRLPALEIQMAQTPPVL